MNIKSTGEFALIRAIADFTKRDHYPGLISIGDDAAAFPVSDDTYCLVTTDISIEGVHFDLTYFSMFQAGWKAMAANISDIAAMGGIPTFALVALGLPKTISTSDIEGLYQGMTELADKYNIQIIGGDTSNADKLTISITLLGEVKKERILLRSGARRGDVVCVTGELGQSELGRKMIRGLRARARQGDNQPAFLKKQQNYDDVVNAHLQPVPRITELRALQRHGQPHAMIDISDGLAAEINHICAASDCGVHIYRERVPVNQLAAKEAKLDGHDPLEWALGAGEDFELLFTMPPEGAEKVCDEIRLATGTETAVIGQIRPKTDGIMLVDSFNKTSVPLKPVGFTHF